jgi:small subunit ribosomal protein S13
MIRFLGIKSKPSIRTDLAISQLYGLGKPHADKLCVHAGILPSAPISSLEEEDILKISNSLTEHVYGGALRVRLRLQAVNGLKGSEERYVRQSRGLPSRGQRTQTNGKTAKRENRKRFGRI